MVVVYTGCAVVVVPDCAGGKETISRGNTGIEMVNVMRLLGWKEEGIILKGVGEVCVNWRRDLLV